MRVSSQTPRPERQPSWKTSSQSISLTLWKWSMMVAAVTKEIVILKL
ncbi:PET112-like (yeast) (predicted), isoform CRA_a, partial [Rattus norvegicus]